MQTRSLKLPALKPRNPLLAAVCRGLARLGTRRHTKPDRHRRQIERMDLDQRVRELGEW